MLYLCYGTRPEWLKIKPLITELKKQKKEFRVIGVAQHTSLLPVDSYSDYFIPVRNQISNRLNDITASVLAGENHIWFHQDDWILVQGDTASAMSLALSAFNHHAKVIHLEAGLRSFDKQNPWPEESYRRMISTMADIHLCPTAMAAGRLENERFVKGLFVVGNTVLDNIVNVKSVSGGKDVLITMHRRENHDLIEGWFSEFSSLAEERKELVFKFVSHPNPRVQNALKNLSSKIEVLDPMGHEDFIKLVAECYMVITDSGGLVEESSFLQKKSVVCRKVTEREEAFGGHSVLCQEPERLKGVFSWAEETIEKAKKECPFGDGHSSEKIVKILEEVGCL